MTAVAPSRLARAALRYVASQMRRPVRLPEQAP